MERRIRDAMLDHLFRNNVIATEWSKKRRMHFNLDKCKVMEFSSVAPSTISACFRKGGFKKSSNLDIIESIDNNQLEFEKLGSVLTNKIVNFDKYAFRHCDDLVPSGETYSDDLVALEQGEQTEEAEPSLTIET
ncbi:hypothetical protein BpHYR1_022880 [Brachionus plicatilis]|uniref:Uncharacterized protein n=1 Tax=Brachionus plicatilis TaxID=10195 RepID=A0A3M7PKP1_BRAPC|nr:hypothetical protein BpHYR1_022880 [Brachionus plicatilis]